MREHVVIVGAGIIGAACAYQLTRAGCRVTLVDQAGPAAGASGQSFGWINASFHADEDHFHLRLAGMAAWQRLTSVLDLPINWCGALWWEKQGAELQAMRRALVALNYEVTHLTRAELERAERALRATPQEALRFGSEAALDTGAAVRVLLAASGAQSVWGVRAMAVETRGGKVTGLVTDQGVIAADRIVLAAGNGAADLVMPLGLCLPMLQRPGLLMRTAPVAARLSHILVTPQMELRQLADGRLLAPTVANHQGDQSETIGAPMAELAQQAAARAGALLGLEELTWEEVAQMYRPVPGDGLPVIGAAGPEGLWLAVMHSGVTLAAITAELLVSEMMTGQAERLLEPYRIARFQ